MVLCAVALKRHLVRRGKPAPNLGALVPEFLPSVPIDYMDGRPMKYRLNSDGNWMLYSVGENGVDDGGDASANDNGQRYSTIWAGRDAVWPKAVSREEIDVWRNGAVRK